jgi:hypothetical protein
MRKMKTNDDIMLATACHHKKPAIAVVLFPFLKHLNAGTLAIFMAIALALLDTTRGKESEARVVPAEEKAKATEAVIDNLGSPSKSSPCDSNSPSGSRAKRD